MIRNKYHIQILLVITLFSFYSCRSMAPFMKNKVDNSTRTFSADIYRDIMGVPHIFGKTDADAVFGLAYAHAEDDFKTIQDLLLGARGMLGAKYGVKFSPVDYYVELIGVWEDINNRYDDEIPENIKLICEAYAQGINKYAFEHQQEIENELFPIKGKDIIAGWMYQIPYLYGIEKVLGKLFESSKPRFSSAKTSQNNDFDPLNIDLIGSNVIAVAPNKSEDGYTRLLLNTHQPWSGPTAWYEAHIHSEDGLNMTGGLFPGSPLINHGHNENIGWSFTSNSPDLIDIYELQINPLNENQYLYDGEWKNLDSREIKLKMKIFGPFNWAVKKKVYKSIHGPVLKQSHGTYAIKYAGINEMRTVEQFYRMNKSKNMKEFKSAMEMQALPMYNTGYADKEGNIFYVYNALIPKRSKGYNWRQIVPGNTSKTNWNEYIKFQDLPQTTNPTSGYFQNCNANPFLATGSYDNITSKGITKDAGIETHQTNRSLRAIKLYGEDSKISRDEFYNYKFDNQYENNSVMAFAIKKFIEEFKTEDLELLAAVDLLKNWNLRTDFDNKAAALAILTFPLKFDISNYKHDLAQITKNLKESISKLKSSFGRFDVPLGKVQRLIRGDASYPLDGGPGNMRAIYSTWENGRMVAKVGDCYVQIVEWSPEGEVSAKSIHQFGSSTNDKNSKFFNNQSILFSEKKMKPVWSNLNDIKNNLHSSYTVTSNK